MTRWFHAGLALTALLAVAGCDARSYDASCEAGQTSSSVPGASCTTAELGQISCALSAADICTPLSSEVVQCKSDPDGGQGAPTWQSVLSCADDELCYFLLDVDGGAAPSNAVGCGVTSYPLSQPDLPCADEGALACSFDTTRVLECKAGAWGVSTACAPSQVCGGVACASAAPYCVGCQ